MRKIYSFLLIFSVISVQVFAGGFQLNEHGSKALGMGNAFTAVANDASAIYWNGAGLTQLQGTHFMVGTSLIGPAASFQPSSSLQQFPLNTKSEYELESHIFYPIHFFAAHKLNKEWAIGLGFTTPFGLGTEWGNDFVGRYLAYKTELQSFVVVPTVAVQVIENLSLSAGFVYSFANVEIIQKFPQPSAVGGGDASVTLDGSESSAFGYNFGILFKPAPQFSIGASFHSEVDYEFEGTATAEGHSAVIPNLPQGDVTAELTTPMNLAFGLAYRFSDVFLLSTDFQYIGWSSYDSLNVNFTSIGIKTAAAREYNNSYIIRLGGEYKVNSELGILAGVYYDNRPVDPERINPSLPDANRIGVSAGIDYQFASGLGIAASFLHIFGSETTVENSEEVLGPGSTLGTIPFNGTYNTSANILSITLSYGIN